MQQMEGELSEELWMPSMTHSDHVNNLTWQDTSTTPVAHTTYIVLVETLNQSINQSISTTWLVLLHGPHSLLLHWWLEDNPGKVDIHSTRLATTLPSREV